MKITEEKLQKLQKLAAIKLPEEGKGKFLESLEEVVNYLHKLEEVDLTAEPLLRGVTGNFMKPRAGKREDDNSKEILNNVEHKLVGNSVTIKSFVDKWTDPEDIE